MEKLWKIIRKYMLLELAVLLFVFALDQCIKDWAVANIIEGHTQDFIPHILSLTLYYNTGAAFSILEGQMTFFYIITGVAIVLYAGAIFFFRGKSILFSIAISMMFGGTLGNFYDRVFIEKGVRDMFQTEFIDFAIFNIADAALTVGVILFAIYVLFVYKSPPPKVKKDETAGDAAAEGGEGSAEQETNTKA